MFQTKQDRSAPSVRNTQELYGVSALPRVVPYVVNGLHSPMSTPETTQITMLLREALRPPDRLPNAFPSRTTAISAHATPIARNRKLPVGCSIDRKSVV